jgi:hypothetical protein
MGESINDYLSRIGSRGGKRRWMGVGKKARQEFAKANSRTYWDNLSPEQRSAEMKRRAQVRKRNRARKSKSS